MNYNQIKKAVALKNWVRFMSEMTVYVLAILSSIIGRSVISVFLAIANGYVGSLAFADLFASRFFKAVMSDNPAMDKALAMHEAHAQAHWAGIVIMLFLDVCIFIFGYAKGRVYKDEFGNQKKLNLEPISLYMAILSTALGGIGFILALVEDGQMAWSAVAVLQVAFGFIFAAVAPVLLFFLTKYIKVADTELVEVVTNWVSEKLKIDLAEGNARQATARTQTAQQIKREPVAVGSTFDFANLDEALNKFKN